jgi:hypothetical protein
MLAHQGAADESLGLVLLFSALWVGWIGSSRIRGTGFPRLPALAGPGLIVAGLGLLVASAVVPPALFPRTTPAPGPRPTSTAKLAFQRPDNGAVVEGAQVQVVLDLEGGTIVDTTSTDLTPDTGHIHLLVDGRLVSMTYGPVQIVDVGSLGAGPHVLEAEFVAADHAPFNPPVTATITFRTGGES